MRPFAVFGFVLVLFGLLGLVFALFAYSAISTDCVGSRGCSGAYPGWFELRVAIWSVFGVVLILFGALMIVRGSRMRLYGGYRAGYGFQAGGPQGFGGPGGGYPDGLGFGPKFCPRCNARNGPRFRFCRACGAPLGPTWEGGPLPPGAP
ncbi:MAG: hypothetical protein L3K17_00580 [Thermoplasmata archaeon]|nr:hypothetical protein [Thermoplasmata archaeon]